MPCGIRIDWSKVRDLGVASDEKIAARLGVTHQHVARRRCEVLGLRHGVGRGVIDWSTVAELGVLPDSEVARQRGVSRQAVTRARVRKCIPPASTRRVVLDLPTAAYQLARRRHPRLPPHRAITCVLLEAVGIDS